MRTTLIISRMVDDSMVLAKHHIHYPTSRCNRVSLKLLNVLSGAEVCRLDHIHLSTRQLLCGNILAPLNVDSGRILDLGTGTGTWCIEVADEFPNFQVYGVDLSPIQPKYVPTNCTFEVMDLNEGLPYGTATFDLVHAQYILGSIPDWDGLMSEILRVLKPGGLVQMIEADMHIRCDDGTIPNNASIYQWERTLRPIIASRGLRIDAYHYMCDILERHDEAEDVCEMAAKLPVGDWPQHEGLRQLGRRTAGVWKDTASALLASFGNTNIKSGSDLRQLFDKVLEDFENVDYHGYNLM